MNRWSHPRLARNSREMFISRANLSASICAISVDTAWPRLLRSSINLTSCVSRRGYAPVFGPRNARFCLCALSREAFFFRQSRMQDSSTSCLLAAALLPISSAAAIIASFSFAVKDCRRDPLMVPHQTKLTNGANWPHLTLRQTLSNRCCDAVDQIKQSTQKVNKHATDGICLWPMLAFIGFAPDDADGDADHDLLHS